MDGSCNPYLAAAAMLAAGFDGIERGLDAGDPNSANLYTMSAGRPRGGGHRGAAGQPARRDPRAGRQRRRSARGSGETPDGDYVDYFIECKLREVRSAHEQITQWELDRYLQLF